MFRRLSLGFAVVLVSLCLGVPVGGAATTLNSCYTQTPTIYGTTDDGEVIEGTPGDDVIVAGAGADTINGNGGRDYICAGGGDDIVTVGPEGSLVAGEDGNDTIFGSPGNDYIDGGRGDDQCDGAGGTDRVFGCTWPTTFVVGQSAPDFIAQTGFSSRFRLANFAGQNVMIDFSAIWCGPSSLMGPETAGVQKNLTAAGIPFQYVLAEVQGPTPGTASVRRDAELMSERFGLGLLPVLHAEGSFTSSLTTQLYEYDAENVAYDPFDGSNDYFPTLVFINAAGIVTDVHVGLLTGQEIEDRYKPGLPAPASQSPLPASLVGVDIEAERTAVDALSINATTKAALEGQLTSALQAQDLWLNPKTSSCDWMKQFDKTLSKTPGIGKADLASLIAGSQAIESKFGCSKK
jgi:Ca2+-binding RTX toxin-like protein